jgi:hypothetical protein
MEVCERTALVAVLVGVLGTLSTHPAAAESVGAVMSTSGDAYAVSDTGRRPLECGSPIQPGERIVTQSGARVGFLASDTYVQLGAGSDVTVDRTAGGSAALAFSAGEARVIDTRESGSPLEISSPHATSKGLGSDTEISVSASGTQLCEGSATIDIRATNGSETQATAGQCVTIDPAGAQTSSAKGDSKLPAVGAAGCIDVAVVDHFTPGVAAPAATIGLAPFDPDRRTFNPCDNVGGPCGPGAFPTGLNGPRGGVIEQPPMPPTDPPGRGGRGVN